jgi:hypothetical protein
MVKCLVTKLNGSVDNIELLRLGEMRIKVESVESPTKDTQGFGVSFIEPTTVEIVGDGYFTDNTLTENKGKSIVVSSLQGVIVSQATTVAIRNKYKLLNLNVFIPSGNPYGKNKVLNIEDLKYSTPLTYLNLSTVQASGDIANLKNLTNLTVLNIAVSNVSGDIANLKNLTNLTVLNIAVTNVSGDIANLKNLTNLTNLSLDDTKVAGDIANLKNLTNLTEIRCSKTQISGDIANLKNLTNLTNLNLSNTQVPLTGDIGQLNTLSNCTKMVLQYSKLTGDLATIPSNCIFISFMSDKGSVFTWSTRPSTAKIIAIEGSASLTNIDKMLQDQAQCQVGFSSSDQAWYKTISVAGNRTSASDDAVEALQQKGYTISIAKA